MACPSQQRLIASGSVACGARNERSSCGGNYCIDLRVLYCAAARTRRIGSSTTARIRGPLRSGIHRNRHASWLLGCLERLRATPLQGAFVLDLVFSDAVALGRYFL